MRNVVVSNLVSLDGFVAGPGGDIEWFTGMADKEFEAYSVAMLDSIDTMLFGRLTYELTAGCWPAATAEADDPRVIEAMNNCQKVVFSRTLKSADWEHLPGERGRCRGGGETQGAARQGHGDLRQRPHRVRVGGGRYGEIR